MWEESKTCPADSLEGHNANIVTSIESVRDAYLLIEKIKSH